MLRQVRHQDKPMQPIMWSIVCTREAKKQRNKGGKEAGCRLTMSNVGRLVMCTREAGLS